MVNNSLRSGLQGVLLVLLDVGLLNAKRRLARGGA
jgi:hypothetical protein